MYIFKKQWRQPFNKEGQTIHHDTQELYAKTTINFIFEKYGQSWDYVYVFGSKLLSEGEYLEEVVKTNIP